MRKKMKKADGKIDDDIDESELINYFSYKFINVCVNYVCITTSSNHFLSSKENIIINVIKIIVIIFIIIVIIIIL